MSLAEIGRISHYYGKISVAIIELSDCLEAGDYILIRGNYGDFEQKVESIQVEHRNISLAKAGDVVGLKVREKVREGDRVYKVI